MAALELAVFSDLRAFEEAEDLAESIPTVFLSICDTTQRATVFHSSSESLNDAWANAKAAARNFIKTNRYDAVWIKADLLRQSETINTAEFPILIEPYYDEFFRKGIALDASFQTAFLEAEINGNKLIDYDGTNQLNLEEINKYQRALGRPAIDALPEEIVLFNCVSFFLEKGQTYPLYNEGLETGRRIDDELDREEVKEMLLSATGFLANLVQDDGKFIYGYYPTYDKELQDYNILRHAGTIWSLINQYKITGEERLKPLIESAILYLVEGYIEYREPDTAYVVERKSNEIKLGGNAIALLALIGYMEEFKNDTYRDLAVSLGNGILTLLDENTGAYYHVITFPGFKEKEAYRTVYYDGEATFALARLYGATGDEKWLNAARAGIEHFIEADYTKYRDHWVAYAMNEITKYLPDERYYEFALRNANDNLDVIYHQETSYHTYLELLMITFELYDRMLADEIKVAYADQFDKTLFIETIFHRAEHMRNGYFYPEYAMYLKNPQRILGAFFVRHDGYRVRIDDVQHFVGGYYSFYVNYDKLKAYREK